MTYHVHARVARSALGKSLGMLNVRPPPVATGQAPWKTWMTLKTLSAVGSLSMEMESSQVPPSWVAEPSKLSRTGSLTGILFIAEMLYEDGLLGDDLHGKSEPSALSGELSRPATLKGTGDDIFMWALATPKRPMAMSLRILRIEVMSLVIVSVFVDGVVDCAVDGVVEELVEGVVEVSVDRSGFDSAEVPKGLDQLIATAKVNERVLCEPLMTVVLLAPGKECEVRYASSAVWMQK